MERVNSNVSHLHNENEINVKNLLSNETHVHRHQSYVTCLYALKPNKKKKIPQKTKGIKNKMSNTDECDRC